MFKRFLLALLAMLTLIGATAGCNTIDGAGKDIQRAGGAISDEASEHRKESE